MGAPYQGRMDSECVAICDAINRIPGLRTVESCCGHGDLTFSVWFKVDDPENLPLLLYYIVPCHIGFKWNCLVHTDCAMSPPTHRIESLIKGEEAYTQAKWIAAKINAHLDSQEELS